MEVSGLNFVTGADYEGRVYHSTPLDVLCDRFRQAVSDCLGSPPTRAAPEPPPDGKPFSKLRRRIAEKGADYAYLKEKVGLSKNSISNRMTMKEGRAWRLDEMYKMMDALQIPHGQMSEYFPKDGGGLPKGKPTEPRRG